MDTPKFVVGDVIRCVRPSYSWFTVGRDYTVTHTMSDGRNRITDDEGDNVPVPATEFELVYPASRPAPATPSSDAVFQPHHYARYVIEPITFINANKLPPNIANVVKYACRYDAKNGIEDLEKAKRYLDIHIECLKRDARVAAGEDAKDVWKVAL